MESYQINDLERLTGIKAHTIRIWEKRYDLISPDRTSTNIRLYNDAQVKKLLNVTTLLEHGYKISKIAALSQQELNNAVGKILESPPGDIVNDAYINSLIEAMLSFNETAFDKIFSAAATRLGIFKAMTDVFYPFLYKTGLLWSSDDASPAQEHFASNIIKRKLQAAIDGLAPANKNKHKYVLFLPPDEWHEIGLLFTNYLIRSAGFQTIYLGQNMPLSNIDFVISKTKPTHLVTFFVTTNEDDDMLKAFLNLVKKHKSLTWLVSGSANNVKKLSSDKIVKILSSPADLLKIT